MIAISACDFISSLILLNTSYNDFKYVFFMNVRFDFAVK